MPVGRFWARLERHAERTRGREKKRRHELWIHFAGLFFGNRGESEPPLTKEEYAERRQIEEGKKKPTTPTEEHWHRQAEARRVWERMRERYYFAGQSPWHWETAMLYAEHLFDKPPEPERKVLTAQEIKEQERAAAAKFIADLEEQVKG